MAFCIWLAENYFKVLQSFKKLITANSSIFSHFDIFIDSSFLQDFPNSINTLFSIGTAVKSNPFMLGAK